MEAGLRATPGTRRSASTNNLSSPQKLCEAVRWSYEQDEVTIDFITYVCDDVCRSSSSFGRAEDQNDVTVLCTFLCLT